MPTVLVPLAEGCEELEAVTVIDLLRRADIKVVVAGLQARLITARRGVKLQADTLLDDALGEEYDMIVLPGGDPGVARLVADRRIRQLLIKMAAAEKFTAAICAAPQVLAAAGLLKAKNATCYPGSMQKQDLRGLDTDKAVVQDGQVITARGPGTAMDFALALIENLAGRSKRDAVEAALVR